VRLKTRRRRLVTLIASVAAALAAMIAAPTAAHANNYFYGKYLVNAQTGNCLDVASNGSLRMVDCFSATHPRWNILSYASDVNNYYSRVQVQNADIGNCLSVAMKWAPLSFWVSDSGCDAGAGRDQWDLTWVGNTSPNASNSWQLFNADFGQCLDSGQQGNWVYDYHADGYNYCPWKTDQYQVWYIETP